MTKRTQSPEQREKARQRLVRWLAEPGNADRQRAAHRRYRSSPKGRATSAAGLRRWRATPKGNALTLADVRRRRALKESAPIVDLTAEDWAAVMDEFDHRCAYCGTDQRITQDHVHPLGRGGSHTRTNVVPACLRCNDSKADNMLAEWYGFTPRVQVRVRS